MIKSIIAWAMSTALVWFGLTSIMCFFLEDLSIWTFLIGIVGWHLAAAPAMEKWQAYFIKEWNSIKDKNAE